MKRLLTDAQLSILRDVAFFHYLTSEQLQRLRFHDGTSPRYAQACFLALQKLAMVTLVDVRIVTRNGKSPYIWKLAEGALRPLRSIGVKAQTPSEERAGALVFLEHHLLVNDFLIAASLLLAEQDVAITRMLHDRELKRTQPYMIIDGMRRQCVPDGFVQFTYLGEPVPIALEVDRDTEKPFLWKLKIRKLVAWIEGPYAKFSGTNQLTIAVVVQGRTPERSEERMKMIMDWTRQELTLRSKQQLGKLFVFSTVMPTSKSPYNYFFSAHWKTPFDPDSRYALIEP